MSEPHKLVDLHLGILHWRRPQVCLRTVQGFLDQVAPGTLTVIDNGSPEKDVCALTSGLAESIRFMKLRRNVGWGPAFNVFLQEFLESGRDGIVGLSAQDTEVQTNCLSLLLDVFRRQPDVGIVCPQYESGHVPVFSKIMGNRIRDIGERAPGTFLETDMPHGTLCFFRISCLREIGLFDERYFAYGDETEIGLRARKKGWRVGMLFGARIHNPERATPNPMLSYLTARNSLLTLRKHVGRGAALVRLVLFFAQIVIFNLGLRKAWYGFEPRSIMHGCWHYLQNRFGKPPAEYFPR